jgi:hypothetical protein
MTQYWAAPAILFKIHLQQLSIFLPLTRVRRQIDGLRDGVQGMIGRLQSERSMMQMERNVENQLKQQLMRIQHSMNMLLSET